MMILITLMMKTPGSAVQWPSCRVSASPIPSLNEAEYLSDESFDNSPLKAPENIKKKKRYSDKTRGTPSGSTPNIASSSNTTSTPESNLFTKEIFATSVKKGIFLTH